VHVSEFEEICEASPSRRYRSRRVCGVVELEPRRAADAQNALDLARYWLISGLGMC
jgi:hypothetical protein